MNKRSVIWMNETLKEFFLLANEKLKKTSGSVEIVTTKGVTALNDEGEHWTDFGASNTEEVFLCVEQLIEMFEDFNKYDDAPSQFMYDVMAILNDFSFHASIFGIYFFSIESLFDGNSGDGKSDLNEEIFEPLDANITTVLSSIAQSWDAEISHSKKVGLLDKIILNCFQIKKYYNLLFEKNRVFESPECLVYLKQLYYFILSLQQLWLQAQRVGTSGE